MSASLYADPREPFPFGDWAQETHDPHGYVYGVDIATDLHTSAFDGLHGNKYRVSLGMLRTKAGIWWNGSNVVKDLPSCLWASFVHDQLCDGINHSHHSAWKKASLRRKADAYYGAMCHCQGMWGIRAVIRFIGLRLAAPWGMVSDLWQRDESNDTQAGDAV